MAFQRERGGVCIILSQFCDIEIIFFHIVANMIDIDGFYVHFYIWS